MSLTAIYVATKFEEYAVGADQLAMAAMQFLRASRGSVDRARLQRLGTPSHVAFWIKEYEIELFATTGFYFPANYPHLLQSVATKIKGMFL